MEKDPLTGKEYFINFIYMFFRFTLYFLACGFIYILNPEYSKAIVAIGFIAYASLSYLYSENRQKIIRTCYVPKKEFDKINEKYIIYSKNKHFLPIEEQEKIDALDKNMSPFDESADEISYRNYYS